VGVRRTGKLVVATRPEEVSALRRIRDGALQNGAGEVHLLTGTEARAIEPELCCEAALLSPETGVIDSHGFLQALEAGLLDLGGTLACELAVTGLAWDGAGFRIEGRSQSKQASITSRLLVLAGGLGATHLGHMLDYPAGYQVPETHFAKGHYFSFSGRAPFRHLIYPVPSGGGLGVHLTLDVAGAARLGPDIEWVDAIDYAFDDPDGARRQAFETAVRRFWPGLPEGRLAPGSTGIRPKLTRTGDPPADFAIHGPREHGIAGLVALYGIESPGLTASLAIGEHVATMLTGRPSG
jgi:L-2-hydroxyglutarate oxidase LhgO